MQRIKQPGGNGLCVPVAEVRPGPDVLYKFKTRDCGYGLTVRGAMLAVTDSGIMGL